MRENAEAGPVKFFNYKHPHVIIIEVGLYAAVYLIKRTGHDCSDKFYNANESRKKRIKNCIVHCYAITMRHRFAAHYREPSSQYRNNTALSRIHPKMLNRARYPSAISSVRCSDNFPASLAIKSKVPSIVPTEPDTVLVFRHIDGIYVTIYNSEKYACS